ncbi:cysteine protease ATG4B isoform X2 [Gouania willdenowi]|uniref:cysteine protease ATG4B isoform X2 n=1 Tax=Gouania willdenowi TaxID=441366 RepID=UPI0010552403|nr:cysteine protease ATG4B isoform X2 [Gouania willdenowi]
MDAATLTYDTLRFGEFEDFPETSEPVWILGKNYNALTEKEDILSDITSRLWFTYRKNFPPIGGTGPTSDTGWGCMLRCGQMILGEALLCRHLGRDWRWAQGQKPREEYISILNAFIDKKDSYYSIHQIAQMGVGEGKPIGQWYGPNTVAQVLKKLAVFDTWSRLVVHVAMDNTVVIEEIKRLCMPWLDAAESAEAAVGGGVNGCLEGACALSEEETALWRPLVLLIPLRLGLSDINEAYIETLKMCVCVHSNVSCCLSLWVLLVGNPTVPITSSVTLERSSSTWTPTPHSPPWSRVKTDRSQTTPTTVSTPRVACTSVNWTLPSQRVFSAEQKTSLMTGVCASEGSRANEEAFPCLSWWTASPPTWSA